MRAFSLAWIQAPALALLQQVAFLSECFPKQELEYKGELHSQTGLIRTRQGLSPRPPVSTATYGVICGELPRAALDISPSLAVFAAAFPMTLDSNPIQVSRMNCSEDQDGRGNGQSEEGTCGAVLLATFAPNN